MANEIPPEPSVPEASSNMVRLQRALAAAGIASRRHSEQIIREGRVEVDGVTVTELGTKVDPTRQRIIVDGQAIRRRRHVYYLLNKPPGILSTNRDESGRSRAIDLIDSDERIYTVGRLDKSSEGLIIVTNDGDLANQLTHPKYGVDKTYAVRVAGRPLPEQLNRLKEGIHFAEGMARVAEVRVKKQMQNCTDLEIVLKEGRNREIRRAMARLGHKVVGLKRIAIGPIRLGELPRGAFRELTSSELAALKRSGSRSDRAVASKRKPRRGGAWTKPGRFAPRTVEGNRGRSHSAGKSRSPRSARSLRSTSALRGAVILSGGRGRPRRRRTDRTGKPAGSAFGKRRGGHTGPRRKRDR